MLTINIKSRAHNEITDYFIFPAKWNVIQNKLYAFYSAKDTIANQPEAKTICGSLNGRLFEPRTVELYNKVFNVAKQEGMIYFWLGIQETSPAKTYVYISDKKTLDWNNFDKNEPNDNTNGPYNDCGKVINDREKLGLWDDKNCKGPKLPFICEIMSGISFNNCFCHITNNSTLISKR